jgi:hypothetical protein
MSGLSKDVVEALNILKNNSVRHVELQGTARTAYDALEAYKKKIGNNPLPSEKTTLKSYQDQFKKAKDALDKYSAEYIAPLQNKLKDVGIGLPEIQAYGVQGTIHKTLLGFSKGGMVPQYMSIGDLAIGTDTVPAMLTPGEFVIKQSAVKDFGVDNLRAINSGTYGGNSVYNYSVNVSVSNAGANANDIAQTVIAQIKQIDSQRIRSNNL